MIRVVIEQQEHRPWYAVWLYRDVGNDVVCAQPANLVFQKCGDVGSGAWPKPEPTFELSYQMWHELRQAVPEAVTGVGIETAAVANAAELKATKYHLEDMRMLAKAMQTTAVHMPSTVDLTRFPAPLSAPDQREVRAALLDLGRAGFCEAGQAAVRRLLAALGVAA